MFEETRYYEPFYMACWTERSGIQVCGHEHPTIREALRCMVPDGRGFLRASDPAGTRSLNEHEMDIFHAELSRGILKIKS
jgi:hypothetical protein